MYRSLLALSITAPNLVIAQDAAPTSSEPDLSYSYVDLRFVDGDEGDSDGLRIGGSYRLNQDWIVLGEITELDQAGNVDQSTYKVGGGYIYGLEEQDFDLIGTFSLVRTEIDGSFFDADDTGFALSGGMRGMLAPRIEVRGSINHVNLDNNDTYLELAGDYYFTEQFSVGASLEFAGDQDLFTVGVRFYPR